MNKLETAVRIKHIPTGVAVRCQVHRTQAENKVANHDLCRCVMTCILHGSIISMVAWCVQKRALEILKAKLLVIAQEQQAAAIAEIRGDKVKAEWGQQIRNYVEHPYKLVKDLRTGHETSNIGAVLDGELDSFVEALLRHRGQAEH